MFLVLLVVRNQRMVPLAVLERAMRFRVVSAIEAAESLIYTILLAVLAYHHEGIWCYVIAMGCRDLVGTIAFNAVARLPLRGFAWSSIRQHVGFSLIYQGASLLNMATLAFPPIVIARLLGKNAVGYASWAATLSLYPLVICNAMGRIYLPAFSSAAGDPLLLRSRVEKSLRINASITWPACAVLASLIPDHRQCVHSKMVSRAAIALRLLLECDDERRWRAANGAFLFLRMTPGLISACACCGRLQPGPAGPMP